VFNKLLNAGQGYEGVVMLFCSMLSHTAAVVRQYTKTPAARCV
jgi:hypothetical protein